MQSMQRSFGKLLNKAPGDNAKVSVLLNDYEDIDKVLAKVRLPNYTPLLHHLELTYVYLELSNSSTTTPNHGEIRG